jgi:hypothetical protein
VGKG